MEEPMARKLRVAMIGCGGIAGAHLRGYKNIDEAKVVVACDVAPEAAARRAEEFDIPDTAADHRAVVARDDVDAVDICAPNAFHMPITVAALKAGKHVLCEKPLARSAAEVRRMIAARDASGKLLMCAQHQRFSANAKTMKAVLDDGLLGDVYYARAWAIRRRGVPAWGAADSFIRKEISGGGPCIDIGVHILDLTLHFMGNYEPVAVTGITEDRLGRNPALMNMWGDYDRKVFDVEDFAAGFVRFANGAALSLECSFMMNKEKSGGEMRCDLFGTEAGAAFPELEVYGEKGRVLTNTKVAYVPPKAPGGHEQECREFVQAALRGRRSPVPAEESLAVVAILEGLYRSAERGKEVRLKL
jgi:predicted dehydrogenase